MQSRNRQQVRDASGREIIAHLFRDTSPISDHESLHQGSVFLREARLEKPPDLSAQLMDGYPKGAPRSSDQLHPIVVLKKSRQVNPAPRLKGYVIEAPGIGVLARQRRTESEANSVPDAPIPARIAHGNLHQPCDLLGARGMPDPLGAKNPAALLPYPLGLLLEHPLDIDFCSVVEHGAEMIRWQIWTQNFSVPSIPQSKRRHSQKREESPLRPAQQEKDKNRESQQH